MMRLVNIDELVKEITSAMKSKCCYSQDIFKIVQNAPTAYDIDKVVEQLEDEGLGVQIYCHGECLGLENKIIDKVKAIEIVKKGGVE